MLEMTSECTGAVITVRLSGRIDSSNAAEAEQMLNGHLEGKALEELILDFADVQYVSSAGLRVLLRLKKQRQNVKIVNVSSEVYEVFDMTGFTDIIEIKKAYRKLDLTGCEIIGKGSNGTVYRYTDDIVVKVYHNNDALEDIHRERELARTALVLGVNTAISYDVAQIGDHYGSVFELIDSKNISKLLVADWENADRYIRLFCGLLKTIHETQVKPGLLPSAREQYLNYAGFLKGHIDDEHLEKLTGMIEAVPEQNTMIHGDYHTSNVYDVNGEAILIDMDTLSVGNPVFEFASVYLAYKGFNEIDSESSMKFMKMNAEMAADTWNLILKYYFDSSSAEVIEQNVLRFKALGYTRLLRRTIRRTPDEKEQIAYLKKALVQAIDAVNSLAV